MYISDRSPVRFEPASKMDASNENFDILAFGYLVISLLIFLVCFILFSIFFCFICLGFSTEDLKCCCHKAHKAFEYEECQLKAIETGMILLIHQLAASFFGSFSRIVNKRHWNSCLQIWKFPFLHLQIYLLVKIYCKSIKTITPYLSSLDFYIL